MMQEKTYNDQKIDLRVWKRLVSYALRSKGRVITTMAVMMMVAVIDLVYPLMTRYAINNFILPQNTNGVWLFGALYLLLVLMQSTGVFLFVRGAGRLERDISFDIRQETFTKLQQLLRYDGHWLSNFTYQFPQDPQMHLNLIRSH